MEVELDAFSGRPNPRWETTSPLQEKLDSLSEKTKPAPEPGLGYRGFIIHQGDKSVRVFSSRVTMERDGKSQTYRDTAGLEAELAKQARQHGYAGIVPDL